MSKICLYVRSRDHDKVPPGGGKEGVEVCRAWDAPGVLAGANHQQRRLRALCLTKLSNRRREPVGKSVADRH